jgi:hypothetical protein
MENRYFECLKEIFIMAKGTSIITIACLCLVFGMGVKSYAQPGINPANIQEQMNKHIEKVKITNPIKYQDMVQRAGGNITHCCSCHVESCKKNIPTQQLPTQ